MLVDALIRAEVVQLILDDLTADTQPELITTIVRVLARRAVLEVPGTLGRPSLRFDVREAGSIELVCSRLRHGRDDRRRRSIVLSAEVLRQNPELLDRVLRERIPPAGVLADQPALDHIVLEADAIDEDIRLLGIEAMSGDHFSLRV